MSGNVPSINDQRQHTQSNTRITFSKYINRKFSIETNVKNLLQLAGWSIIKALEFMDIASHPKYTAKRISKKTKTTLLNSLYKTADSIMKIFTNSSADLIKATSQESIDKDLQNILAQQFRELITERCLYTKSLKSAALNFSLRTDLNERAFASIVYTINDIMQSGFMPQKKIEGYAQNLLEKAEEDQSTTELAFSAIRLRAVLTWADISDKTQEALNNKLAEVSIKIIEGYAKSIQQLATKTENDQEAETTNQGLPTTPALPDMTIQALQYAIQHCTDEKSDLKKKLDELIKKYPSSNQAQKAFITPLLKLVS